MGMTGYDIADSVWWLKVGYCPQKQLDNNCIMLIYTPK